MRTAVGLRRTLSSAIDRRELSAAWDDMTARFTPDIAGTHKSKSVPLQLQVKMMLARMLPEHCANQRGGPGSMPAWCTPRGIVQTDERS